MESVLSRLPGSLRRSLLSPIFTSFSGSHFVRHSHSHPKIVRPNPPHWDRAKVITLTEPYFISPFEAYPVNELCDQNDFFKNPELKERRLYEITEYEKILFDEFVDDLKLAKVVVIIHSNIVYRYKAFPAKLAVHRAGMKFCRSVSKKMAHYAMKGTKYENLLRILGTWKRNNIFLGNDISCVKKLLTQLRNVPEFFILAAVVEDRMYSFKGLEAFSKMPSIDTLRAQLCSTLSSAAGGSLSRTLGVPSQELSRQLGVLSNNSAAQESPES